MTERLNLPLDLSNGLLTRFGDTIRQLSAFAQSTSVELVRLVPSSRYRIQAHCVFVRGGATYETH